MKTKRFKKIVLYSIILLLVVFIIFNIYQSVPQYNDLSDKEKDILHGIALDVTKDKITDIDKISAIMIYLRENVNFTAPIGYDGNKSYSHDAIDVLNRKWGLCYDFSYIFELMSQSVGFKTRHVALVNSKPGSSHAVSEVLINNKWVFFDPSNADYYTDSDGNLLSIYEIKKLSNSEIKKVSLIKDYDLLLYPNYYKSFSYGLFNFHGQQFEPKISYPDMIFSQVFYNLGNIYFPFSYGNLYYVFILGFIVFLFLILYFKFN